MKNSKLVYSTESGRIRSESNKEQSSSHPQDGIIRLMRQTKGRKGKGVTLINGLPLATKELKNLAKALKQKCGCGGAVRNGIIEIQGDHREILEQELVTRGYKVTPVNGK